MVEDLKPLTSLRFVAAMMIVALHSQLYFPWGKALALIPALDHGALLLRLVGLHSEPRLYLKAAWLPAFRSCPVREALARTNVLALIVLITFVRPQFGHV